MPDGDKFERRLWGKGLRKAYRTACGTAGIEDLVPQLHNAMNHLLGNGLDCPVINDITVVLNAALNRPLFSEEENIGWLSHQLDAISSSQEDSQGTRIAVKAAKAICAQQISSDNRPSLEQLKSQVRRKFKEELLDNQFFSRVREGIMKETKRDFEAEIEWEKKLSEDVVSYKRTPHRWLSSQGWNKEKLNQPIPVLEEQNV